MAKLRKPSLGKSTILFANFSSFRHFVMKVVFSAICVRPKVPGGTNMEVQLEVTWPANTLLRHFR